MASRVFKFQVLGVGLSRTGTTSLAIALDELLAGECLDLEFYRLNPFKTVRLLEDPKVSNLEFQKFFEDRNLVAALQFPIFTKYKRVLEVFPEAKVILSVRDPESWIKSMKTTSCILKENFRKFPHNLYFFLTNMLKLQSKQTKCYHYLINERVHKEMEFAVTSGEGIQFYNAWIDEVRKAIPNDRLLVYDIKEGWEPLCSFLNVPVPSKPFPKLNINDVTQDCAQPYKTAIDGVLYTSWSLALLILLVPIIIGFIVQKLYF